MSDAQGNQGGGQQAGGGQQPQVGSAGGDVEQMTVGELINVAQQNNLDVSALNELVGQIQSQVGQGQGAQESGGGDAGGDEG